MSWLFDLLTAIPTVANLVEKNRALTEQKDAAEQEVASLKDDNRKLHSQIEVLEEKLKQFTHKEDLDVPQLQILTLLAQQGQGLYKSEIREHLNLHQTHLDYHVEALIGSGHLKMYRPERHRPSKYRLTQKGRDYALKNNLA